MVSYSSLMVGILNSSEVKVIFCVSVKVLVNIVLLISVIVVGLRLVLNRLM